ncbi:hypothetical protein, partial [Okeania sp. SIO3I5]|uniref:hypothetical protein n=1 Tax=Okeania sp. SIO3I5 TaxID=2607805 RepID=UPI0025FDDFC3
ENFSITEILNNREKSQGKTRILPQMHRSEDLHSVKLPKKISDKRNFPLPAKIFSDTIYLLVVARPYA